MKTLDPYSATTIGIVEFAQEFPIEGEVLKQ